MTLHDDGDGRRHLGGLNHCGRITCPVCGPYIMAERISALKPVVARVSKDQGLRFFFVVLTLRHRNGAGFRDLVKVLRVCQRSLIQHARWRQVVEGWIRVLESTHGRNGHHPHENLILAVDAGVDADAFFQWVEATFAKVAKKQGRTVEWAPGWWREVPREELQAVLKYMGADDKMGHAPGALREILGAAHKHQPLWAIPPKAFAEVWMGSKGMRWFGTGGIFKGTDADKSDEEISDERENSAPAVAHVPEDVFRSWTPEEKRDRQAVMVDRSLTLEQVVAYVVACGGVAGPPPDPWAGAEMGCG